MVLVSSVNTPRLQALLAYLILQRYAPQARRHLAFLFWPDSTETQARTNLRHLLHELLRALPDAARFLCADTQTVQWRIDGPYKLDVGEFDSASASDQEADLRRAFELYRGDLLPRCYDDWIAPERERVRCAYAAALERLITLAEARQDISPAITYARRLLEHDPCHESAYHSLMRLHALNGDRAAALHIYHTCVTVLRRELGVPPDTVGAEECGEHLENYQHLGWSVFVASTWRSTKGMLATQSGATGGPPTPEQAAELSRLQAKLATSSTVSTILTTAALALMAVARYL